VSDGLPAAWVIVVAAGSGARFGGPKQWAPLAGRRVIDWTVAGARASSSCAGVVVVVPAGEVGRVQIPGADVVVAGGATRSGSVRAGLAEVPAAAEVVVVHDGARPLAPVPLFDAVVSAVASGADAAIPGVALTDTVKRVGAGGLVTGTVDRSGLVAVQTPQAFAAGALRRAHAGAPEATDDGALVEAIGGRVVVVAGHPDNIKLTEVGDLAAAERALGAGSAPVGASRVGLGFDVHPFSDDPERVLVLGGVTFPGERALAGHSDADAVAHAATDALLGAAGLGDIGEHFPDTDPRWAGADSIELLRTAAGLVRAAGWEPGNVDCSVVCDRPRLAPQRDEMQRRLSVAAGADVTVKGRRPEGLGALGRGEGVACWAVAVVVAPGGGR
jgi:2-C-methyl-D-erythritol 4-phosphate cytidylyltransferase/2-C-methyl-D-erythritol 2,4-cyclodiphosphate synthase